MMRQYLGLFGDSGLLIRLLFWQKLRAVIFNANQQDNSWLREYSRPVNDPT